MPSIWLYAEMGGGRLASTALELLARARMMGDVTAVALGPGARAAAATLGEHGAARVLFNEDSAFSDYIAEPQTDVMSELIRGADPDLVLFGFTPDSRDVAGRLAARLDRSVISNAIDFSLESGVVRAQVPYFGGSKTATYRANQRPALVLVRPRSFDSSAVGGEAEVDEIPLTLAPASQRSRILERRTEVEERVKLEEATVIVAGGRGLGEASNFKLLDELAQALGAAVGASRAVVDAGWVPYAMQVGQTGKTVSPTLYLAAGISGAMQHTVGMKTSKFIIAINKDREAPIMKLADLAVVGDALRILPGLVDALRGRRGH